MKNQTLLLKTRILLLFTLLSTAITSVQSQTPRLFPPYYTEPPNCSCDHVCAPYTAQDLRNVVRWNCGGHVYIPSYPISFDYLLVDRDVIIYSPDPGATLSGTIYIAPGKTLSLIGVNITSGGIYNDHGTLTLTNCTLYGNSGVSVDGFGGAIWNHGGTMTLNNCTLRDNSAINGGAIYNSSDYYGSATLTINNSTISGNSATSGTFLGGGGILNDGLGGSVTVTIAHSTISGNSTWAFGGGIYNLGVVGGVTMTISNSTISGNSAAHGFGGGIQNDNAMLTIGNTILNTGGSGSNIYNRDSSVISLGHNLSNDDGGGYLTGTGDQINTNPMLGPLQANGGRTFTHALLPGSPAIDAGTDLTALNGAIDDITTSVTVTDATGIIAGGGLAIQIDSEQMAVTAKSGNTLTVTRGANGTMAAAHNNGAAVNTAFDQRDSGFARKVGNAVDIGAFEVQAAPSPTPTATATSTPVPTPTPSPTAGETHLAVIAATGTYGGMVTLSATLTSNSSPLSGKTITFTLSGNSAGTGITDGSGVASVTNANLSGISAGTYSSGVAASFAGDGSYSGSTGTAGLTVTARGLTVTATGIAKVYDGTTAAAVTLSDDRIAGDALDSAFAAASFADKNVGTNKPVSVTGISIGGSDADNYRLLNTAANTTANITARGLTVTATGIAKVYDGTTAAVVTLSDDRIAGDSLTSLFGAASFADKNVGLGKAVSVTGISISGGDAGNYNLLNTTANTTANMTARGLTVTAAGIDKEYDGTTAAAVTLSDDRIGGDALDSSYLAASFADPVVGTNKFLSVAGISISGGDAGNYHLLNPAANTTANITLRTLLITAQDQSKIYGAPFTFNGTEFTLGAGGLATGDTVSSVTLSSAGAPATAPYGTYPISVSAAVGSGLSNYAISYAGGTFSVTRDPTSIVYTGFVEGNYLGTYTASAMVSGSTGLHPQGATVHFSLSHIPPNGELQGCSGTVDASGFASCQMQLIQPAGTYEITASFLGNDNYMPSSTATTITVAVSATSLVYTGPSLNTNNRPLSVSGVLTDTSANTPISGQSIAFSLGGGAFSQSCTGITNSNGIASCTIASVSQPLGPASITMNYAGDGSYLPASTTSSVLVFDYATGGSFVIGRSQAIVNSDVTFWGAGWTNVNMPDAPPSFKGFAPRETQPACGDDFRFDLGSVRPPTTVPAYMAVIASTRITQSGSTVVGDSPRIVIVRTAAGYQPNPGNPGTGTVVAVVCGGLE